jgi:tetratricopeptide (TPR) repeat protein
MLQFIRVQHFIFTALLLVLLGQPGSAEDRFTTQSDIEHLLGIVQPVTQAEADWLAEFSDGTRLQKSGYHKEAAAHFQQAVELAKNLPDPNAAIAATATTLGVAYKMAGDYPLAESTLKTALQANEKSPCRFGGFKARILYQLGTVYFSQEKFDQAKPALEQSIKLYETQTNLPNAELVNVVGDLAYVNALRGDLASSAPLFKRAGELALQSLGPDHPTTKEFQHMSATIEAKLNQHI